MAAPPTHAPPVGSGTQRAGSVPKVQGPAECEDHSLGASLKPRPLLCTVAQETPEIVLFHPWNFQLWLPHSYSRTLVTHRHQQHPHHCPKSRDDLRPDLPPELTSIHICSHPPCLRGLVSDPPRTGSTHSVDSAAGSDNPSAHHLQLLPLPRGLSVGTPGPHLSACRGWLCLCEDQEGTDPRVDRQ